MPVHNGEIRKIEVRSPDPMANPYLAYALLIHAGLEGIADNLKPVPAVNVDPETLPQKPDVLPDTLEEASRIAKGSPFVKHILPEKLIQYYG